MAVVWLGMATSLDDSGALIIWVTWPELWHPTVFSEFRFYLRHNWPTVLDAYYTFCGQLGEEYRQIELRDIQAWRGRSQWRDPLRWVCARSCQRLRLQGHSWSHKMPSWDVTLCLLCMGTGKGKTHTWCPQKMYHICLHITHSILNIIEKIKCQVIEQSLEIFWYQILLSYLSLLTHETLFSKRPNFRLFYQRSRSGAVWFPRLSEHMSSQTSYSSQI